MVDLELHEAQSRALFAGSLVNWALHVRDLCPAGSDERKGANSNVLLCMRLRTAAYAWAREFELQFRGDRMGRPSGASVEGIIQSSKENSSTDAPVFPGGNR